MNKKNSKTSARSNGCSNCLSRNSESARTNNSAKNSARTSAR